MIDDELIKIWKSSTKAEQVKFEKSRLMIELQTNIDSFNKKIKFRDAREIIAALIVIPVFIYYIFTIPHLLSKIASGLIVIWAGYVIYRLLKTRKLKPSEYSENYLSYLKNNKVYFQEQKSLIDGIFWWYIAPFVCFLLLFVVGFLGEPGKEEWVIQTMAGGVILAIIIYVMNKNSSKKDFDPKINKIEKLIKTMEDIDGALQSS